MDYDLDLREEAFGFLLALPEDERSRILHALRAIRANPFAEPDFDESMDEGQVAGVVASIYAIFYHVDHAVKRIRVIDITFADRI